MIAARAVFFACVAVLVLLSLAAAYTFGQRDVREHLVVRPTPELVGYYGQCAANHIDGGAPFCAQDDRRPGAQMLSPGR